jgi:CelD/BcsL family acetyltransferase involved in cellulose biosynthesis
LFEVEAQKSFDFLSLEYAELFSKSRATAFQHPLWLDRLYDRLAPGNNATPLVITVRSRADGKLAMVLPLVRQRRGAVRMIEFADLRVSDYAAPVCDDVTFSCILRDESSSKAIQAALQPYDLLRIQKMFDRSVPLERLLKIKPRVLMDMSAHSARLSSPYAQWRIDCIDRSYRKELDKKARQLGRKGAVRFVSAQNPELIKSAFLKMREYRRARFQDQDLLQNPLYFEFYLEVAIKGAQSALARTYALLLDDQPIAAVMGLAHKGNFLVILGGFDLAGYKNYSIGSLVFDEIAKDCIERGEVRLDFTIGDESYKQLFGAQPSSMWMISAAGSPLGSFANFMIDQIPWAKHLAKRLVRPSLSYQ